MSGILGCDNDYVVAITDTCGAPRLCDLIGATEIEWGRKLDDVSEAKVVVASSGEEGDDCCECLGDITPWCHELHIFRGDEEVWCGPVQDIEYTRDTVTVYAKDILAWASVQYAEDTIDFCESNGTSCARAPLSVIDMGQEILNVAFAQKDPCLLTNVQTIRTPSTDNVINFTKFEAFDQSALEQLVAIAEVGLDFTTLGRSVILQGENLQNRYVGVITNESIMGGDNLIVAKRGSLIATTIYTRYDKDTDATQCANNQAAGKEVFNAVPCPATATQTGLCYGSVERVRTDANAVDADSAAVVAQSYLDAGLKGGYTIEFPSGSWLSPDTTIEINELIPGQNVRVLVLGMCVEVAQTFRIQEVNVIVDTEGEKVGLTLGPLNAITGLT